MKRLKKMPAICAATGFSFCLALGFNAADAQTGTEQRGTGSSPGSEQQETQREFGAREETETPTNRAPRSRLLEESESRTGRTSQPRLGQGAEAQTTRRTQVQANQGSQAQSEMEIYEVSELEGLRVESRDGQNIGSVQSLAVDLHGDGPSYVVVETGGVLGIDADTKVVPLEAIEITQEDGLFGERQVVRVDIDEAGWEQIRSYESEEIAGLCGETQAREVYQHFNIDWDNRTTGASSSQELRIESDRAEADSDLAEQEQQVFGSSERRIEERLDSPHPDVETQPGLESAQPDPSSEAAQAEESDQEQNNQTAQSVEIEEQNTTVFGARESGQTGVAGSSESGQTAQSGQSAGSCELVMTSDLRDRAIHDAQQQEIGSVQDVVLDLNSGRVNYVLVSPQTGTERSGELFAIGPRTFRSINSEEVILDITSDQLQQAETLTQSDIRNHSRTMAGTTGSQSEQQVFRYQRDQIEFGRADRQSDADQQEDSTRPGARNPEGVATPPTVTTPSARERERQSSQTPGRDTEFGSPGARDPNQQGQQPPHAGETGRPPHAGETGQPPHARGQEREGTQPSQGQEREAETERAAPPARNSEFGSPGARDQDRNQSDARENEQQESDTDAQDSERDSSGSTSGSSGSSGSAQP